MEFTEYVEFELDGDDAESRLAELDRFVQHLRIAKAADQGRQVELEDVDRWLRLLPLPFKTGFEANASAPAWMPRGGFSEPEWDIESMLEALLQGEYELSSAERFEAGLAQLRFLALAWPFGGVGSLVRLVEGFGFAVRAVQDGCGLDHRSNRRPPAG